MAQCLLGMSFLFLLHLISSIPDPLSPFFFLFFIRVVWTSIGLYPLAGNGTYMIGSPLYPNITISLQPTLTGSKSSKLTTKLQIIAHNASPTTPYVQNAVFNGATLTKPFITYDQLSAGGILEMWMGSSASTWGKFTPPV